MSGTTHVWLLHRGFPKEPQRIPAFLCAILQETAFEWSPFQWLRQWLARFCSWRRAPLLETSMISGSLDVTRSIERQAEILNAILGVRYRVRPVSRYDVPSVAEATQGLRKNEKLVILPMFAHPSPLRRSCLIDAHQQAKARGLQLSLVDAFANDTGFVEAMAETIRQAIAQILPHSYEVMFCVPDTLRPAPYLAALEKSVQAIVDATTLRAKHHLYFFPPTQRPGSLPPVSRTEGTRAVLAVPLAHCTDNDETTTTLDIHLKAAAKSAGFEHFVRTPVPATRPAFNRTLACLIRQAEQDMEWEVPELLDPTILDSNPDSFDTSQEVTCPT